MDIGANIGEFTIAAANKFKNSIIYAFEPDPLAFECLKFNVSSSNLNSRVIALKCALSDNTGQSVFYISSADADSSLVKPGKFTETIKNGCRRF
jgi:FkbM family methyltransferase